MIGSGEYDNDVMQRLPGVGKDYENVRAAFNGICGFDMVYVKNIVELKQDGVDESKVVEEITGNEIVHLVGKNIPKSSDPPEKYKLKWHEDEMKDFLKKVHNQAFSAGSGYYYDGIIFIYSGHGERDNQIYDHEGEFYLEDLQIALMGEPDGDWNKTVNIPKFYFVDACHGDQKMQSTPISASNLAEIRKFCSLSKLGAELQLSTTINPHDKQNEKNKEKSNYFEIMYEKIKSKFEHGKKLQLATTNDRSNNNNNHNKPIYVHEMVLKRAKRRKHGDSRLIWANVDTYAIPDGGTKGGYLIRGLVKTIKSTELLFNNFDAFLYTTKKAVREMSGAVVGMVVEDMNLMTYTINFEVKNQHDESRSKIQGQLKAPDA